MAQRTTLKALSGFTTSPKTASGYSLGKVVADSLGSITQEIEKQDILREKKDKEESFLHYNDLHIRLQQERNQANYSMLKSDQRDQFDRDFEDNNFDSIGSLHPTHNKSFTLSMEQDRAKTDNVRLKEFGVTTDNMIRSSVAAYGSNITEEHIEQIKNSFGSKTQGIILGSRGQINEALVDFAIQDININPQNAPLWKTKLQEIVKDPKTKKYKEVHSLVDKTIKEQMTLAGTALIVSGEATESQVNAELVKAGGEKLNGKEIANTKYSTDPLGGIRLANKNGVRIDAIEAAEKDFNNLVGLGNIKEAITHLDTLSNATKENYVFLNKETKTTIDYLNTMSSDSITKEKLLSEMYSAKQTFIQDSRKHQKKVTQLQKEVGDLNVSEELKSGIFERSKYLVRMGVDTSDALEVVQVGIEGSTLEYNGKKILLEDTLVPDSESLKLYSQRYTNTTKKTVENFIQSDGLITLLHDDGTRNEMRLDVFNNDYKKRTSTESQPAERSTLPFGGSNQAGVDKSWFSAYDIGPTVRTLRDIATSGTEADVVSNISFTPDQGEELASVVASVKNMLGDHIEYGKQYSIGKQIYNVMFGNKIGTNRTVVDDVILNKNLSSREAMIAGALGKTTVVFNPDGTAEIHDRLDFATSDTWKERIVNKVVVPKDLSLMFTAKDIKAAGNKYPDNDKYQSNINNVANMLEISKYDVVKYGLHHLDMQREIDGDIITQLVENKGTIDEKMSELQKWFKSSIAPKMYNERTFYGNTKNNPEGMIGPGFMKMIEAGEGSGFSKLYNELRFLDSPDAIEAEKQKRIGQLKGTLERFEGKTDEQSVYFKGVLGKELEELIK